MGRWKKEGGGGKVGKPHEPPKRVLDPLSSGTFLLPSGVVALSFLYRNPRLSTPGALLEGSETFSARGGCVIWCAFLPPYVLQPPYHGPTYNKDLTAREAPKKQKRRLGKTEHKAEE